MKQGSSTNPHPSEKPCTRCKKTFPATTEHFSPRAATAARDGLASWCKGCMRQANKDWKAKQPDTPSQQPEYKAEATRRRRKDPELRGHDNHMQQQRYYAVRLDVLEHYNGSEKLRCKCCGETEVLFLSLDHVDGGGKHHRWEAGNGITYWRWFMKNNYPRGFQILCHNCNLAKGFYGECPHETKMKALLAISRTEEPTLDE